MRATGFIKDRQNDLNQLKSPKQIKWKIMSNPFIEFQNQVEAVKARYAGGEISEVEQNDIIRQMKLKEERWGDIWMLSPKGEWFRKAAGSERWIQDYPNSLVDATDLPPVSRMNLQQIAWTVHQCTRCTLCQSRTRAVPGEGPAKADIMFIGEGPGFHEDKQARPFVGASGQFLDQLLNDIGYKREDVFIANVVKCRPPNNRDPEPEELAACKAYLDRQVEWVDPKVIVTLGRFSKYRYFPNASITKIHGQPKRVGHRLIVPMFHPAAALHQPKWKPALIEDFQKLPQFIAEATTFTQAQAIDPESAQQLSLF
jgi:DNA polymerase